MQKSCLYITILIFSVLYAGCFRFDWNSSTGPYQPTGPSANDLLAYFGKKPLAPAGMIIIYIDRDSSGRIPIPQRGTAFDPPRLLFGGRSADNSLEISNDSNFTIVFPLPQIGVTVLSDEFSGNLIQANTQVHSTGAPVAYVLYSAIKITKFDKVSKQASGEFAINFGGIYYGSFTDLPLDYLPSITEVPGYVNAQVTDTIGKVYTISAVDGMVNRSSETSATLIAHGFAQGLVIDSTWIFRDSSMMLSIEWKGPTAPGSYSGNQISASYSVAGSGLGQDEYSDYGHKGENAFTITSVDTAKHIMSGTFHLQLYSNNNKPIKIDNGTFTNAHW